LPDSREFAAKLARVRRMMEASSLTGVALQKPTNLAWLLCGAEAFVARTVERGSLTVVVAPHSCHALMNAVEAPRLADEEIAGLEIGHHVFPWHHDMTDNLVRELGGPHCISDTGSAGTAADEGAITALQVPLTEAEVGRYRALGRDCGEALGQAMCAVRPGMTEHSIAGLIAREVLARGIVGAVLLVATDERVFRYRHPVPTHRKLEHYAMGVLVGRRGGLHASLTRSVHFGPVPEDLAAKQAAVAGVDAAILAATKPGATAGDAMSAAQKAYAAAGYPDEWHCHHQGGATGYQPRTWRAMPGGGQVMQPGQAFAWNPSLQGTKSEDTVICWEDGVEVLTATPGWPTIRVAVGGRTFERPGILTT